MIMANCKIYITDKKQYPQIIKYGENCKAVKGEICERYGGFKRSIIGAKIFIYNQNEILVDQTVTNENGEYLLFLPTGNYNIHINGAGYDRTYKDYHIDGINYCWEDIKNGLIFENHYDVYEYLNTWDTIIGQTQLNNIIFKKKLICGNIVNEHNLPISGAEIIISKNDDIITYYKTDENGFYKFAINEDIYDVRILSKNYPIKVYKNFNFMSNRGFMNQIINSSNNFRSGEVIVYK